MKARGLIYLGSLIAQTRDRMMSASIGFRNALFTMNIKSSLKKQFTFRTLMSIPGLLTLPLVGSPGLGILCVTYTFSMLCVFVFCTLPGAAAEPSLHTHTVYTHCLYALSIHISIHMSIPTSILMSIHMSISTSILTSIHMSIHRRSYRTTSYEWIDLMPFGHKSLHECAPT